jgi:hypothetical protein
MIPLACCPRRVWVAATRALEAAIDRRIRFNRGVQINAPRKNTGETADFFDRLEDVIHNRKRSMERPR